MMTNCNFLGGSMSLCTVCGRDQARPCDFCARSSGDSGDSTRPDVVVISAPTARQGLPPLLPEGTGSAPPSGSWDPDEPYLLRQRQEPVSPRDQESFSAFFATVNSYRGALPAAGVARSGGRTPRRQNRIFIAAAVAVVVLGAAGGAFALTGGHGQARAADQLTGRASTGATPSAAGQKTAASPAPTVATASPGHAAGRGGTTAVTVAVAAGLAGNPAEPQVAALLDRYFTAINTRDYAGYARLLDRQRRRHETASSFRSGYSSTTDSDATLTDISATGSGGVAASVTFTSHQKPAKSLDHSSCTLWSITLYLVRDGGGYLIGTPPPGYLAYYQAC
jgi:hypothetical protein